MEEDGESLGDGEENLSGYYSKGPQGLHPWPPSQPPGHPPPGPPDPHMQPDQGRDWGWGRYNFRVVNSSSLIFRLKTYFNSSKVQKQRESVNP